jgi:NitT/TauT family transport system substrate-binding protein
MTKRISRILSVTGTLMGLLAVAACGSTPASDSTPTIRIATGVDPGYAQIFLADQEGIFRKHGLNVEIVQTEGGPAPIEALSAGEVQLATNSDATAVTRLGQASTIDAMLVLEESSSFVKTVFAPGISDSSQLRTMGVVPGLSLLSTVRYLESEGIDRDDIEFIKSSAPELTTLLARGDIDAYVTYEPWATRGEAAGGKIVGNIGDFGLNYAQWLLADSEWLKANSSAATDFVNAILEANEIVKSDPDRAAAAAEKATKVPAVDAKKMIAELDFTTRDFTDKDLEAARATGQFFVDEGVSKVQPNYERQLLKGWFTKHVG